MKTYLTVRKIKYSVLINSAHHRSGIFMNNSIQQPFYELPPQGSYLSQHDLFLEQPEISNQESQHHSPENDLTTENKKI